MAVVSIFCFPILAFDIFLHPERDAASLDHAMFLHPSSHPKTSCGRDVIDYTDAVISKTAVIETP